MAYHMQEKLQEKLQEKACRLCLGIDPVLRQLPSFLKKNFDSQGAVDALRPLIFGQLAVASSMVPAVKFQSAFFEALGWQGMKLLSEACAEAKKIGMFTILDAKRGDISSTMHAYGVSAFDQLDVDCMTIQAYMGLSVLEPLLPWLKKGKGVYLVYLTSNPEGDLIQNFCNESGDTVASRLRGAVDRVLEREGVSESLGLVLGATKVAALSDKHLQDLKHRSLLLPGFGAQKATVSSKVIELAGASQSLFPMSRGLTGVGHKDLYASLNQLPNLDSYLSWFEKNIRRTMEDHEAIFCL